MMTVTAYLFEYTLNVVCGGNKSECARKLDVRRQDLNRMQKRFADGANSVRTIESILLLFWKEGRSLDQALQGYTFDSSGEAEAADASPLDAVRLLREEMSREWQQASTRMQLFKSAETFMGGQSHILCKLQQSSAKSQTVKRAGSGVIRCPLNCIIARRTGGVKGGAKRRSSKRPRGAKTLDATQLAC